MARPGGLCTPLARAEARGQRRGKRHCYRRRPWEQERLVSQCGSGWWAVAQVAQRGPTGRSARPGARARERECPVWSRVVGGGARMAELGCCLAVCRSLVVARRRARGVGCSRPGARARVQECPVRSHAVGGGVWQREGGTGRRCSLP